MRKVLPFLIAVAALAAAPTPAQTQSASELLERGIYTEETVGDLDRALEIYTEIVDKATAHRPQAAEALFRIGMCNLKKDDPAAAAEAFERIIAEYPDQETFVTRARENMPDDPANLEILPAPWPDGEVLRLSLRLTSGIEIGTLILTVESTHVDGADAWRMRTRRRIYSDADNQAISEVLAHRDTYEPIRSTFKHSIVGHYEAVYGEDAVQIETVGRDTTREAKLDGQVFDNEQGFHLFRALPLALDYEARLKFIAALAGEVSLIDVEVIAVETITVGAGEFECYRMKFSVPQTFWFSTEPPHRLVKLEASGIVGELEEFYEGDPERSTPHVDEEAAFSVESPPGWLRAPFNDGGTPKVVMLDPNADTRAVVRLHPAHGLCSYQAAAMRKQRDQEGRFPDYTLREGSWVEREINGRPSVHFEADFHEGERDLVQHWTYIESGDYCVEFDFTVDTDNLEDLRADFDAIVEGYDGPRVEEPSPVESSSAEGVRAMLTEFHQAASNADLHRYLEHIAPDVVFLATDRTERFEYDELKALAESYFSRDVGWVAKPVEQNVFLSDDGTMAWFDEELESRNFGEMRASGVLRLEEGRWRVVQYNVVFPVPNKLAVELIEKILEVDPEVADHPTDFSMAPEVADDDPGRDVKNTLRDFHLAAAKPDARRYFDHLAEDVIYFGTDRSERFTKPKLRAFLEPFLASGTGWKSIPIEQNVFLSPDGKIAWFDERIAREGVGELRGTGVLRKDDGAWKIVHYNRALPVPNELAEELVGKISSFYGPR